MKNNFDKTYFKTLLGLNLLDDKALEDFIKENYTAILNLKISDDEVMIEFVIDLDPKFSESLFIEFWRKYNMLYNQNNKQSEVIDDVEIYFDNRIGIVAPLEPKDKGNKPKNPTPTGSEQPNKYKYNILKVIEKRNQEEEAIEELIAEFEKKISSFFDFIKTDDNGQRLIAKIKDEGSAFSQEEIYLDFTKLYRKYTIKNKDLGDFFIRETKGILNQLCDDFEKTLVKVYTLGRDESDLQIAAESNE